MQVIALIRKLHQNHLKSKEPKQQNGSADAPNKTDSKDASDNFAENGKGRKPNFLERKRFVQYDENGAVQADDGKPDKVEDLKKTDSEPSKKSPEKQVASLKEEPAKPPAITDMFEVEEEEVVSMPAAKKNKPEAVRSAAPPKKAPKVETKAETKVEELKLDDKKQSSKEKDDKKAPKKEKTDSYSDEWGADDDLDLEDKGTEK